MITPKKKLRAGRPLWLSYAAPAVPFTPLEGDTQTDVAVIGAGITGAMVAQEMAEAGFSVLLLDRRAPLAGSTMATTALLQAEIDEPLVHLRRKIGVEKAQRAWQRSKLGLESLSAKIQALDIACGLERRASLYLTGNILNAEALKEEAAARNAIGLQAQFLGRRGLLEEYGIRRSAALKVYDSIAVNPRRLATGFLLSAIAMGARIHAPVSAVETLQDGGKLRIVTSEGPVVTASHVVFATGYEIPKYVKSRRHHVHSTWAIATRQQPDHLWPQESFIWEASTPYLYLRTTPDGRVICGGEDEEFSDAEARDKLIPAKTATLERKLAELFPGIDPRAEFAWAGSFGSSNTGLPSIGAITGMPHCYAVMAFGGNGITYGRIAAELIRSLITGARDPDAGLFAFP